MTAITSWNKYQQLTDEQKEAIAEKMIVPIKSELEKLVTMILDNKTPHNLAKVLVEIYSNLGEVKCFEFSDAESAINFLEDFCVDEILDHEHSFTIFDKPDNFE